MSAIGERIRRSPDLWAAAALAAAAAAAFSGSVVSPFIAGEDLLVLAQPGFAEARNLVHLLSPEYFRVFGEGGYRPLATLSYFAAFKTFGFHLAGYKLLKLLLFWGCSLLLYRVGTRLLGDRRWALAAALIYSIHPAHVPAVSSGLLFVPDLLSAFWGLAAADAYLRAREGPRSGTMWAPIMWLSYLLALLSKESVAGLPLILLAHHLLFPPEGSGAGRRGLRAQVPLWIIAAAHVAALFWLLDAGSFYGPLRLGGGSPGPGVIRLLGSYLAMLLSGFGGSWSAAVLALMLAAALRGGSRGEEARHAAFGLIWIAAALLPVLGLVPFPKFAAHLARPQDFRLLFASAGFCLLTVRLLMSCWELRPARVPAVIALSLVVLLGVLSGRARVSLADRDRLGDLDASFPDTLLSLPFVCASDSPDCLRLGELLEGRLGREEARFVREYFGDSSVFTDPRKLQRIKDLGPDLGGFSDRMRAERAMRRGESALGSGELETAWAAFSEVARLDPAYPCSYLGRAQVNMSRGEPTEAAREIIRHDARLRAGSPHPSPTSWFPARPPISCGHIPLHRRLEEARRMSLKGVELFGSGRGEEGLAALRRAVELNPAHIDALISLAAALEGSGKTGEALGRYGRAIGLMDLLRAEGGRHPSHADVLLCRADLLKKKGDRSRARRDVRRALLVAPPDWPARSSISP